MPTVSATLGSSTSGATHGLIDTPQHASIRPATYNLQPATFLPNRNCQELKIDVTRCKQRTATLSNRNRRRGKAKGETTGGDHHESKEYRNF